MGQGRADEHQGEVDLLVWRLEVRPFEPFAEPIDQQFAILDGGASRLPS